ncbi:CheR family methyltransferase [Archangium lansingense]|uniref:Chemotaxis protein CheR n=1 Tax=Archangium lansingense TaxID=2995310 RepID=A0ABT4A341_9BACT|nr:CheR family methyltransferase [Archangium lansinium]MCY1076067.1 chemotaxis protein CheR [Archangium lansinium]
MSVAPARSPLVRFVALVEQRLGLHYEQGQWGELEPLLAERSAGCGVERYLEQLAAPSSHAEWKALAERLTVGETYFLRHPTQLETLVDQVLPSFQRQTSTIRVLCAGCSTGEEPYSVALLARERGRVDSSRLRILGIDVNPRAIAHARRACYSPWSLRAVPSAMRQQWFQRTPEGFALLPQVRDQVIFEERNLLEEASAFWAPGSFHAILCRNVILYFPPDVIRKIIARMSQALVPGGYLFMGPSETLRGISEDFELLRGGDAFYYRLKPPAPPVVSVAQSIPAPEPVQRGTPPAPTPPPTPDGLEGVLQLLEAERYTDAWALLESLPQSSSPKAQLLRAVLHLHAGRLSQAEQLSRQLVTASSTEASAYYLLGLCLEQSGDEAGARGRYAASVRAEPTFALAHLRAGTLARRAGEMVEARVALRMAVSLLPQEKPLHLSLFGGGFGRHGLMQVGLQELQACTEVL